ncbi:hypothetical protein RhiirA1_394093 [Rhizophagus irregularis]|uniref:Uncharacterized protein n=1 Tax=Rhizophagus irregularis TaxID=588596 RepID=A0A2N0RUJ7_9GLOM|nr:hypothetical protein RhiirA1_394093 [Rhizophagus irregularis]
MKIFFVRIVVTKEIFNFHGKGGMAQEVLILKHIYFDYQLIRKKDEQNGWYPVNGLLVGCKCIFKDNIKLDAYIRACDEALLDHDGYRRLAAVKTGQRKIQTLAKVVKYQLQDLQENGISVNDVHWSIDLVTGSLCTI